MITSHAQPRLDVIFENLWHLGVYILRGVLSMLFCKFVQDKNLRFAFSMPSLVVKFASLMSVCMGWCLLSVYHVLQTEVSDSLSLKLMGL